VLFGYGGAAACHHPCLLDVMNNARVNYSLNDNLIFPWQIPLVTLFSSHAILPCWEYVISVEIFS
jgi:hypothetical protein